MTDRPETTPRTAAPPNVIDLKGFMLRIVAGLDPVESITPRLQALSAHLDEALLRGRYLDEVVKFAVASGHLGLLNRVLDEPLFCPTEQHRALDRETRHQRFRLYGAAIFNGGLHLAVIDPQRPGVLSAFLAWTWNDWERTRAQGGGHTPEEGGPVIPKPPKAVKDAARFWTANFQAACQARCPQYRAHREVNLVGQAVMMGWPEGVQALLDHGVDPYARCSTETQEGSGRTFVSPVVLAGEYDEVECLRRLVQHPSFASRRLANYGHDEKAWAKLRDKPDLVPWRDAVRHGGLEIEFVLESATAMADPVIRAGVRNVVSTLNRSWLHQLNDPITGLSTTGRRTLEALTLENLVQDLPTDTGRFRPRL